MAVYLRFGSPLQTQASVLGANLREVTQEEYVRRNASPEEVEQILSISRFVGTPEKGWRIFLCKAVSTCSPEEKWGDAEHCLKTTGLRGCLEEGLKFVEIELSPGVSV